MRAVLLATVVPAGHGLRGLGRPQVRLQVADGDVDRLADGVHCALVRAGTVVAAASVEVCRWSRELVVHPVEPFPNAADTRVEVVVHDLIRARSAVGSAAELVAQLEADAAAVLARHPTSAPARVAAP